MEPSKGELLTPNFFIDIRTVCVVCCCFYHFFIVWLKDEIFIYRGIDECKIRREDIKCWGGGGGSQFRESSIMGIK